jgi:prophage regulatory protein
MTSTDAPKFLRRPEVEKRTGLSTSTLYSLIAQGKFPKPIKITGHRVAWIETEVDDWAAERIAKSREAA